MTKIGRGRYADVYKVINTVNDQLMAIKILKTGTNITLVRKDKIKREI